MLISQQNTCVRPVLATWSVVLSFRAQQVRFAPANSRPERYLSSCVRALSPTQWSKARFLNKRPRSFRARCGCTPCYVPLIEGFGHKDQSQNVFFIQPRRTHSHGIFRLLQIILIYRICQYPGPVQPRWDKPVRTGQDEAFFLKEQHRTNEVLRLFVAEQGLRIQI